MHFMTWNAQWIIFNSLFILTEIVHQVHGDEPPWWFPSLNCRQGYIEGRYDSFNEAARTGSPAGAKPYKVKAKNCTGYDKDDVCLKACVFDQIGLWNLEDMVDDGVDFELKYFLYNLYGRVGFALNFSNHIYTECLPLFQNYHECEDFGEGIDCILSYLNCSRGFNDVTPFFYYPPFCHKLFQPKYSLSRWEIKEEDALCHAHYREDPLCAKVCMLDKLNLFNAYDTMRHSKREDRRQHAITGFIQSMMVNPGFVDEGKENGEYEGVKALEKIGEQLLDTCEKYFQPFMLDNIIPRRMSCTTLVTCNDHRDEWQLMVDCVEKFWNCYGT